MKVFLPLLVAVCLTCGGAMQNQTALTVSQDIANANGVVGRINGVWQALGTGISGGATPRVYAYGVAPDGRILVGGLFETAGGVTVNNVALYDPATNTWSALGTGTNGAVTAIAFGPDGTPYIGGAFTTANGVAVNYIAKWNGTTFVPLATGLSDECYALAFDAAGNLYAGGAFDQADGTTVNCVAKWDGAAWSALGTTGVSATVFALAYDPAANAVYAGGLFATAAGVTVNCVAKWDVGAAAWSAMGSTPGVAGGTQRVYCLAIGPDGRVYAGGDFASAGGAPAANIAVWNGSSWAALSTGLNNAPYALAFVDRLYAGGVFTAAGGLGIADRLAAWDGSRWSPLDIDLPGTPTVNAIGRRGPDLFIGFSTAGTATASGVVTAVTNAGSLPAYPRLVVKRSGGTSATLEGLRNLTTGDALLFDYPLADGEEVTVDLKAKTISSTFRGNALATLLPGSNFARWALQPGANDVALYISQAGAPTLTAFLLWNDAFASAGGAP